MRRGAYAITVCFMLCACGSQPWNSPYPPGENAENILYTSFRERPNHLDPVQSYSSNEIIFTGQIYEPPLQYHYLKRPYQLVPLAAREVPVPYYLDHDGRRLPDVGAGADIAVSVYEIHIRPGVRYQPHPAFARGPDGEYRYLDLTPADLGSIHTLGDFPETGTRELTAADYVYEIKRLAHPRLHSPILGLMSEHIVGLKEFAQELSKADHAAVKGDAEGGFLDLRDYPLAGAEVVDRYTYRVRIRGEYPQFVYWLAMPFFAPVPWEADRFYSQPGMNRRNITLDWYPVGTGPYMLTVNNPNRQMVLERNPNFHGETYPTQGEPDDTDKGYLVDAGKVLPFIDKVVFSLEKEDIPYWNKFLQGYYDASGINSDSFDQAVRIGSGGEVSLTDAMRKKGISLTTSVSASIFYTGFNMLDPVVGGYTERARKLRQAISIAVDTEEYISIFLNGRGLPAHGPIPPGIFGHVQGERGVNDYVYAWIGDNAQRRNVDEARRLLAEAGYPDGRDAVTGAPLVLNMDTPASGPDSKAQLDWMRKQFDKLNVQLVIRATDYNRFQEKMLNGTAQIFQWGWNADYPDPENFLFMLYGPNSKVDNNGENAANYRNDDFDRLFEQMKTMKNGPERQAIIDRMVDIVRRDAPWLWGYYPKQFSLHHAWYTNAKTNLMANNTLKYRRILPDLRVASQARWNRPLIWPLLLLSVVLAVITLPAVYGYRRRQRLPATAVRD
jgi:oligopeptide transport system substrate-binding protein